MLLVGVKENNGWLLSRWNLTYRTSWRQICKAVQSVYDYYSQVEILVGDALMDVETKDDVLNLEETASLTIRGMSNIVKVPIMITFVNQTNVVDVNVAQMTEEFSEADYQKFNMSLCQYMDSIELAMHR